MQQRQFAISFLLYVLLLLPVNTIHLLGIRLQVTFDRYLLVPKTSQRHQNLSRIDESVFEKVLCHYVQETAFHTVSREHAGFPCQYSLLCQVEITKTNQAAEHDQPQVVIVVL